MRPVSHERGALVHTAWRVALAVLLAAPVALLGPGGFAMTPAAYAQQTDGVLAVVNVADAPLLAAPGGARVGALALGSVVTAVRRTADGQMVEVVTEAGASGWVSSTSLVAFGLDGLPAVGAADQSAGATATQPAVAAPTATNAPATATPAPSPTATQTPTPAPTATPLPTATPTALPSPTPLPTVAAAAAGASSAGQLAVVGMGGTTLYDAPDGAAVAQLAPADTLTVIARDATGAWLYATHASGDKGWTTAADLVVFGVDSLPVLGAAPAASPAEEAPAEEAPADATPAGAATAPPPAATVAAPPARADVAPGQAAAQVNAEGVRLNVRSGPGASYRVVGKAADGETLAAVGRNDTGNWVRVARADLPGGEGWVAAAYVVLDQPIDLLPVVAADAAPAATASAPAATAPAPAATVASAAVDTPTRTPAALATPTRAATPTARTSPTGLSGKLAFMDGLGGIFLYEFATGAVRRLTSGYDPELSPDGRQVVFTRGGNDNNIYVINVDGSGEREVFGDGEVLRAPKWRPDGQRIVFSRYAGDYRCFDTEFFGCITLKQLQAQFPQIPPQFLYRLLNGAERIALPNFNISGVNLDGSEFRDINALDSAVAPDWNEAGIVYQSTAGLELTQDTSDGQTEAIFQEDWDWDPDWQPNGGRIVFQSKEGPHWEIWSITPDGGGIVALTRPVTTLVDELPSNVAPAWSPDGQHIAYVSNRDADNGAGPWRIWVMNADGSNQRPLDINIPMEYTFAVEQMVSWGK